MKNSVPFPHITTSQFNSAFKNIRKKKCAKPEKKEPLQFSVPSSILFFSAIQNRARCCSLIFLIKAEFETNKFGVLRVCFHVLSSAFEIVNTTTLTLVGQDW